MKELQSLYLKDVVVYKEADLPLNYVGITQIRGVNKDSKSTNDKNSVGKSLLLRPLSEITFGSSPLTEKMKSKTKMDLLTKQTSELGYTVKDRGKEYTFIKKADKKSFKFLVKENGKDTEIKGKNYAQERIQSVMNYSEEEFYTFCYIDSSRPNKLQLGTSAERLQFFTSLFKLESYDNVRKIFNSRLAECKKSAAVLKEVKTHIADIKVIPDKEYESQKKELSHLKEDSKKVIDSFNSLSNKKSTFEFIKNNRDNYVRLVKLMDKHGVDFTSIEKLKAEIKDYETSKKLEAKWSSYKESLKTYKTKTKSLQSEIEELTEGKEFKIKALIKSIDKLSNRIKEDKKLLKSKPERPEFNTEDYNKLKREKLKKPDDYKESITIDRMKIQTNEELLDNLSSIKGSECPTCTQSLSKENIKKLKQPIAKKLSKSKERLETNINLLKKAKNYEALKKDKKEYERNKVDYESRLAKYNKAKKTYKENTERLKKLEKISTLYKKLSSLESPTKPKEKPKSNLSPKDYKEKVNLVTLMESMKTIHDDLVDLETKYNFDSIEREIEQTKKKYKKLDKKLSAVTDKISYLSSKITNYKNDKRKLKKLKTREKELQKSVDDIPVIETIIEAYSNKGMKLSVIKQIAKMLENNMNRYAPLLFAEKTKFIFSVESATDFSIKLERKVNGAISRPDVRTLSGAERRAFSFLLPLAILPMIPKERRLNVMVLDEPMTNMSDARQDLFINSFVPKLSQIVPHLIIISIDNEEYKNARVFTAIKEKGRTTLVKS